MAPEIDRDEHGDNTRAITSGDTGSVHQIFRISQKINPLMVLVDINDRWVEMEIDTGAAASLISRTVF